LHHAGTDTKLLENAVALGAQLSYAGLDSRLRFSDLRAENFSGSEYQKTPIKLFVSAWGKNTKTPQQNLPGP